MIKETVNVARLLVSAVTLARDPDRLDRVFDIVGRVGAMQDTARIAAIIGASSEAAAEALRTRPMISYDLVALGRCAPGTVGRAVADHCAKWKIHPSAFPKRPLETPAEYALAHIENTHDVWHPVCGFDSDVIGEIGLQAFYLAQLPNVLGMVLLGIAPLRFLVTDPFGYAPLFEEITRGWVLGKRAKPLFGVRWDQMWDRPLADVRRELGLDIAAVTTLLAPGSTELAERLAVVSRAS